MGPPTTLKKGKKIYKTFGEDKHLSRGRSAEQIYFPNQANHLAQFDQSHSAKSRYTRKTEVRETKYKTSWLYIKSAPVSILSPALVY